MSFSPFPSQPLLLSVPLTLMNSLAAASASPPPSRFHVRPDCACRLPQILLSSTARRRPKPKPNHNPSDRTLEIVIDPAELPRRAASSLQMLSRRSLSELRRFASSGSDALEDLRTLVALDRDGRVLISCRRSTLEYLGHLVLLSCAVFVAFRVLGDLGLRIGGRFWLGRGAALIRRDRSLAGREVIVAAKRIRNPLSPPQWDSRLRNAERVSKPARGTDEKLRLPKWWPDFLPRPLATMDKEEHQQKAKRLTRAITESRMSGQDIKGDDIIQLRRICRASGARVPLDTVNTRNSVYRAAVDFVLSICSCATIHSTLVCIDGEDAPQFIAGFADNIGVDSINAARIVSAAVAARTRSCFIQAWAFRMQGKHSEAVVELSKICLIHKFFPPEDSSPEMEMVALGLKKHLKLEQRTHLMDMILNICGEVCHRSAAEALGLEFSPGSQKQGG